MAFLNVVVYVLVTENKGDVFASSTSVIYHDLAKSLTITILT